MTSTKHTALCHLLSVLEKDPDDWFLQHSSTRLVHRSGLLEIGGDDNHPRWFRVDTLTMAIGFFDRGRVRRAIQAWVLAHASTVTARARDVALGASTVSELCEAPAAEKAAQQQTALAQLFAHTKKKRAARGPGQG